MIFWEVSRLHMSFLRISSAPIGFPTISLLCPGRYITVVPAETAEVWRSNGWSPAACAPRAPRARPAGRPAKPDSERFETRDYVYNQAPGCIKKQQNNVPLVFPSGGLVGTRTIRGESGLRGTTPHHSYGGATAFG